MSLSEGQQYAADQTLHQEHLCLSMLLSRMYVPLQDQKKIEQQMKNSYPPLKHAGKLQWAFKVRWDDASSGWYTLPHNMHVHNSECVWHHPCCHVVQKLCLASNETPRAVVFCRDKKRPNAWLEAEDMTILPEQNALEPSLGEQLAAWFKNLRK